MYFMPTRLLMDNINEVHVTKFQLPYIRDTTRPLHKKFVKMCHEVQYM